MRHTLRYAANCSLLFTELPLLQRAAAARGAGFDAVEFWWPWPHQPVPPDAEADAFIGSVRDAGVTLVGLNFFAGDLAGPDCGVLSIPARSREFQDNVDVAVAIGAALGATGFNALYGNRVDDVHAAEQDEVAIANLGLAADKAATIGATVLLEPVSGPKPYPLRTAADVVDVLDRVQAAGADNVGLLLDLFHLANNGDDVTKAIDTYAVRVAHVQVADHPGRHEPGTGQLDLDGQLGRLEATAYDGWVALEYNPAGSTVDSLGWLPRERRGSAEDNLQARRSTR